LRRSNNSDG